MLRSELINKVEGQRKQFMEALEARLNERWQTEENTTPQYVDGNDRYSVHPEIKSVNSVWVSRKYGKGFRSSSIAHFEDSESPTGISYDITINAPNTFSNLCYKWANNLFAQMPGSKRTELLPFEDADDTQHETNLARAEALMSNVDTVIGELSSHQHIKTAYASSGKLGVFHQIVPYRLHVEFDAKCLEDVAVK